VRRFELRCDAGSPLGALPAIWAAIRKQSGLAEKIILPGDRDRLGCVTQIRVRATCQRDEFSLCTSKFESDHPSHAVGLEMCRNEVDVSRQESRTDTSILPRVLRTLSELLLSPRPMSTVIIDRPRAASKLESALQETNISK